MAFYRCGGGGIPSSLKTDMNAVFNKKFGTAVDYPPEGWPDDVNLMGPLPEKTIVSSPIADFSDGADDVPTKSLVVTIPPTLSGVSSVTETQTGKTIFYPMDIEQGTISGTGDNTNSTTRIRTASRKAVSPSTEYKIKVNSEVQIYEVHEYTDLTGASTHLTVNASEYTFTTQSTTNYLRILFRYSNNATILPSAITELQVTDGNFFWKVYTASLGRTIYGGQADVVNGGGQEQYQKVKVSDLTWKKQTTSSRDFFIATINDQETTNTHDVAIDITGLSYAGMVAVAGMSDKSLAKWLQSVRIYDTSISSVSDLLSAYGNGEIVFYLKDTLQTDFTFDGQEVPTRLGYNAFWSDEGDTEVTYRADINLALGGQ